MLARKNLQSCNRPFGNRCTFERGDLPRCLLLLCKLFDLGSNTGSVLSTHDPHCFHHLECVLGLDGLLEGFVSVLAKHGFVCIAHRRASRIAGLFRYPAFLPALDS